MKLALAFFTLLIVTSAQAQTPATLPPKKKSAAVKKAPPKVATRLPEYKGKKKIQVDFAENSGSHTTTVIVRQPLTLEKALESATDEKIAAAPLRNVPPVSAPTPPPTPPPIASTTPTRAQSPVVARSATLTPAPAPLLQPLPIAGPVIETPIVVTIDNRVQTESVESSYMSKRPLTTPRTTSNETRFFARAAYLNARYSAYADELQNGATSLSLGLGREWNQIEGRLAIELGHGLDQEMTFQNTRYALLRADAMYSLFPGSLTPFASAGVGYGSANVRSYRSSSQGDTLSIREHAKVSALILTPAAGVRFALPNAITIDLTAEYLAFIGGGASGELGGWTGALTLGLPF